MRFVGLLGVALAVGLVSSTSLAFQEQGAKAPAAGEAASAPAAQATEQPQSEFATQKPEAAGTEVRIPGLGKLGVLPKMDFGLELLYGANETAKPADQPEQRDPAEELMIRGSVKHNF